jgi:type IV pilus assembly protein PilW
MKTPVCHTAPSGACATQRGFSLVELMVALVLGLVIVGGVINIFLSNQQAFRTNDSLGRLQENARISFEQMAREVRQAGGNACGATGNPSIVTGAPTDWTTSWETAGAIQGFDGGQAATGIVATGTATAERVDATDAIKLLSGNLSEAYIFTSPAPTDFTVPAGHGLTAGLLLACDVGGAIVGVGNVSAGSTTGVQIAANTTNQLADGGFIARYSAGFWYIGNNDRGGRSLFRTGVGTGNVGPVEIAEGVTDLQIDYLLRPKPTDPDNPPGPPDSDWAGANALVWNNAAGAVITGGWTDDPNDPTSPTNPTKEVVAVRLTLTLETQAGVGTAGAQPITRQLIHVVNLRNRGMR